MVAMMGSSLNLVSCKGNVCVGNGLLDRRAVPGPLRSTICYNQNYKKNKDVNLKLSSSKYTTSGNVVQPFCLSSSHTQAEVENHDLQLERPQDKISEKPFYHAETIHIKFHLKRECSFGQRFLIVGDHPMFGLWDPKKAIPMVWSDGHLWTLELDIPVGDCIKFKFIKQINDEEFMWQPGPDRILKTCDMEEAINLYGDWKSTNYSWSLMDSRMTLIGESTAGKGIQESVTGNGTLNATKKNKTKDIEIVIESDTNGTNPKVYAKKMKGKLVSDEGDRVLIPGVSPLPKRDTDRGEESVNGAPIASA